MTSGDNFCHQGTVVKTSEGIVYVKIQAVSACASCQAKSMCNLNEVQDKIIEVYQPGPARHKPGDVVTVVMKRSMGNKALLLGYLLPFLIVMITLFLFSYLTGSELQAGILSLVILIPYYMTLHFFREKLKNTFSFEIE
jgi:positive regulator of sigma E activity